MWFCLSSGARPRYLDDIVRAMALPAGAELSFRFEKKLLGTEALEFIHSDTENSRDLVIAYLDRAEKTYAPFMIPCRKAKIFEVSDHGLTITLVLKVSELTFVEEIDLFQRTARESCPNFPSWVSGKLDGDLFLNIPNHNCEFYSWTNRIIWHSIVSQLARRPELGLKKIFLQVLGVREKQVSDYKSISDKSGAYELEPNTEYVFDVYHFHPEIEATGFSIGFGVSRNDLIQLVSTSSTIVDSRYDQKRFRFRTGSAVSRQALTMLLEIREESGKLLYEFDLLVELISSWKLAALRSLLVGFFVAAPGILAISAVDKFSFITAGFMIVLGILAGISSTFLLPKVP